MIAENRCCKCGHEWQDKPMGFARIPACPACGSAYWEWTNYPSRDDGGEARREAPKNLRVGNSRR